jgi:large subunit ribosomal protein L10
MSFRKEAETLNREQKAAVVEEVAGEIRAADAIFAIDYRGLTVTEAAELRTRLREAGANLRVVKNRLTLLAADAADAEYLKEHLEGPTALTFVVDGGDAALAAKALAQFERAHGYPQLKGGALGAEVLSLDQVIAISRLPARDQLQAQLVGMVASPITGLVRGLGSLIQGLALQLGQIAEQGLVAGEVPAEVEASAETTESEEEPAAEAEAPVAEEEPAEEAEAPAAEEAPAEAEAPGDDTTLEAEAPAEGESTEKED